MRLGAVVLAAGASKRLGEPKQWLRWEGETLLRRAVRIAAEVAKDVVVVLPPQAEVYVPELDGLAVRAIANPEAEEGMASSLRLGIRSLGAVKGAFLLTIDQYAVSQEWLRTLKAAFEASPSVPVASAYSGTVGIPALLPASLFPEVAKLQGDRGAKALLTSAHALPFQEGAWDVDTPEDLKRFRR